MGNRGKARKAADYLGNEFPGNPGLSGIHNSYGFGEEGMKSLLFKITQSPA